MAIKLIWDFHGGEAAKTAEHHAVHLEEFGVKHSISDCTSGVESLTDLHHIAWMVVPEDRMIEVRDALRPHRGQKISE